MIEGTGPAAIYVRISDDPELARLGVQRQERECKELAVRLGWPIGKVYEDDDRSAFKKNVKRRAYLDLLADIKAGKVRRLIAWHPDRIHRQPSELEAFIESVDAAKVAIATVQSGALDLSTPDGRMVARITGSVAARESEHKSERVKSKMAELIRAGKWTGGPRPFGWQADGMTENPKEAKLLREAKDRALAGESLHAIVTDWNRRGIRGTRSGGKVIKTSTLKRMLTSPRVVGRREHGPGEWAPIFSEDEWQKLRLILRNHKRASRPTRRYMLTGELLKCGLCGGPMYGAPTFAGKPSPHYSCKKINGNGCGRITIAVEFADQMVMVRIADFLNSKTFKARIAKLHKDNPGLNAAVIESARVESRLTELGELYGDGSITKTEWLAAKAKLEPRRKAADAALEAAQAELAGLSELAGLFGLEFDPRVKLTPWLDRWHSMDVEGRRRVVQALVERVTIHPHKGAYQYADPERVEVSFRE